MLIYIRYIIGLGFIYLMSSCSKNENSDPTSDCACPNIKIESAEDELPDSVKITCYGAYGPNPGSYGSVTEFFSKDFVIAESEGIVDTLADSGEQSGGASGYCGNKQVDASNIRLHPRPSPGWLTASGCGSNNFIKSGIFLISSREDSDIKMGKYPNVEDFIEYNKNPDCIGAGFFKFIDFNNEEWYSLPTAHNSNYFTQFQSKKIVGSDLIYGGKSVFKMVRKNNPTEKIVKLKWRIKIDPN